MSNVLELNFKEMAGQTVQQVTRQVTSEDKLVSQLHPVLATIHCIIIIINSVLLDHILVWVNQFTNNSTKLILE